VGVLRQTDIARYAASQKSVNSGGGSGEVMARYVNKMPVSPRAGSVRQVVPVPPSHP
jgi:hypothetical protein